MSSSKFISDKEIDLNQSDFLKTKVYADNLVNIINNSEKDKVFTIGLYGSWGSGKSSIIETAKKKIEKEKDQVKFITYDAWQYSNDSFRRMFLRCLCKELKYSESDFMKRFYENESMDVDNRFKLSSDRVSTILFSLLFLIIVLWALPFEFESKMPFYAVFTILGLLFTLFTGAFHQLKISVIKPYLFAPEQFEECFKEIATKSLKSNSAIENFKYLVNNDKTVKDLSKLVIVIDNIDRCNSETAYQLLTDIKTFLGSQKFSIVFIIPVDDKALLKHFFSKENNEILHNDKEEFLRKIFNVTLRIKPYNATDMFAFTKSICVHNNLNFKNETINIIGKEYSNNPRRVIQLLNNLIVELNNYESSFSEENETIICCVLILREEYPKFYDAVYKNATMLIKYDSLDKSKIDENTQRFMRIASNEFRDTSNGLLNTILTNSNSRFNQISTEVIDMIETFDNENLTNYISENENIDEEIYNYLCHKIDEAHDNDLNDLSQYIQLAGLINNSKEIPKPYLLRIFEKFKSKLELVFHHAENLGVLMNLVEFEYNHFNRYKLKNELIEYVEIATNSTDENYKKRWLLIYNSLIVNLTDDETSLKIKEDYNRKYSDLTDVENLTDGQFKILVTNLFIEYRTRELNTLDIKDKKYLVLKNILDRFEDKLFVLEKVFARFNSTDLNKNEENSRFEYSIMFDDFIKFSSELGIRYKGKFLTKNLEVLFNEIEFFDDKLTPKKIDFFKTLEKDSNKLTIQLDLLFNYYSLTGKLDIIEQYLVELDKYIKQQVRAKIVELLGKGENINFYIKNIEGNSDYSDENLIKLKKYFLTVEDSMFNVENEITIIRIIEDLFIWIDDEEYHNKIIEILEYVIDNQTNLSVVIKAINAEHIKNKHFDFLYQFSEKLKVFFANNITSIHISDFLNDYILNLVFELDNEYLNNIIIDNTVKNVNSITDFDRFLIKITDRIITNKKSDISLKLKNEIEYVKNKIRYNIRSNTPIVKRIKENLVMIEKL